MIIDESNQEIFEKVKKITLTEHKIAILKNGEIKSYIDLEGMLDIIQDLLCEIDSLNEQIKDREQDIADNYKRISIEEMI